MAHPDGERETKMKKRDLGLVVLAAALLIAGILGIAAPAQAASPGMSKWVDPLPVPPVAQKTFNPAYSGWADYYVIDMRASQHQFNAGLPGPATVWTYGQPGQRPRPARPDHRRQDGPAGGGQVHQQPADRPERLPAQGCHRSDDRRRDGAHGRGHPASARRAHRGALRRDTHAVVDRRRPEGRGLRQQDLHLHERPAGVAALVPRPHHGGDALQAVPRPGRGLRALRQGRYRHEDQRPERA